MPSNTAIAAASGDTAIADSDLRAYAGLNTSGNVVEVARTTIGGGGANSVGIRVQANDNQETAKATITNTLISGSTKPIQVFADNGRTATATVTYSNYAGAAATRSPPWPSQPPDSIPPGEDGDQDREEETRRQALGASSQRAGSCRLRTSPGCRPSSRNRSRAN